MPQLSVGASRYSSRFNVGNEPDRLQLNNPNGYGSSAGVTQLVFDFNHSSDLVRQSNALKLVAVHDLDRAKADLALQALDGYYLVGEAHRLVTVNERNVANRLSQLQLAQSRFNSGLGGADDVLTAQTAKGDAVISLVQARTTEDSAKVSLLQTLGLDPQTTLSSSEMMVQPLSPSTNLTSSSPSSRSQRRPEVQRAKSAIDAAKFGAKAAKTTSAPVVSGNIAFSTNDPGYPGGGGAYGVGVFLNVPLYAMAAYRQAPCRPQTPS